MPVTASAPYIKSRIKVNHIMLDVCVALLPVVVIACMAYGMAALQLITVSVICAVVSDMLFSTIFLKKKNAALDFSAAITGILLALTLSPLVPLHVVAFGACCAVLFGKVLWGGIGKNRFNPALVGREYMAAFFPAIMTDAGMWKTAPFEWISNLHHFSFFQSASVSRYSDSVIYQTSGALGEYSILAIFLGGGYLVYRNRISWHIPVSLLAVLGIYACAGSLLPPLPYSMGGVLLGAVFMATDMPSSPVTANGKLYYGAMIAIVSLLLIRMGIRYEYLSFSILLLNGFTPQINKVFKPLAWGIQPDWKSNIENAFTLTLTILAATLSVSALSYYSLVQWPVYILTAYIILKFIHHYSRRLASPV